MIRTITLISAFILLSVNSIAGNKSHKVYDLSAPMDNTEVILNFTVIDNFNFIDTMVLNEKSGISVKETKESILDQNLNSNAKPFKINLTISESDSKINNTRPVIYFNNAYKSKTNYNTSRSKRD